MMHDVRTTVTIDEDVAVEVKRLMSERGATFKGVINELLRRGLRADDPAEPYDAPVFTSGVHAGIDLDRAGRLAAALEDAAVLDKFEMGK